MFKILLFDDEFLSGDMYYLCQVYAGFKIVYDVGNRSI